MLQNLREKIHSKVYVYKGEITGVIMVTIANFRDLSEATFETCKNSSLYFRLLYSKSTRFNPYRQIAG